MAFWNNFGKKKEQPVNEADADFKAFGKETNEIKTDARMSRGDAVKQAEAQRRSEQLKDNLLEKLAGLRREVNAIPDFDEYYDILEEAIGNLKKMGDNTDKSTMAAVDNFIIDAVNEAANYIFRKDYIALGASIENINQLINDRFRCGNYYKNSDYRNIKLRRGRVYVEMQRQQSLMDDLEHSMKRLEQSYKKPNSTLTREAVARKAQQIREQKERIKSKLDNLEEQLRTFDIAASEIEA